MTGDYSIMSRSLVDVAMGRNPADIVVAANRLARAGCGQIVVRNGEVIDLVELPIAGLMSNESADLVAQKAATVLDGFSTCGCKLNNPNMQLSLMSLVAIPELRISDKRLVDITTFNFIPVLEP